MYTSPKVDVFGKLRRCFLRLSTGRTVQRSLLLGAHFVADQLVGLLGARFFAIQLVGLFVASSSAMLGAHQLSWGLLVIWIVHRFIVRYAWGSPVKLGTPRCLDCLSLHRQLSWELLDVWIVRRFIAS